MPIGDKLAQAAARLFMLWWDNQFLILVKGAGINVTMYKRFVDDSNLKAVAIDSTLGWDSETRRLVPVDPKGIPSDEHTATVVMEIANSVTSMLRFTCDFPSKHRNNRMPVLDICMWTTESNHGTLSNYEFYSKPMANDVMIPATSALSNGVKLSTYRQAAFRILRNTAVHLPWHMKVKHLNELNLRMVLAGYSEGFRVKAMEGGIKGFMKHLYRCEMEGRPINRPRDLDESRRKKSRANRQEWISEGPVKYDSVLFVPATHGSQLAKEIRGLEEANRQGRKTRIRVVELTGQTVRNTLAQNYPWKFGGCGVQDCFHCSTTKKFTTSCRTPGVGYRIICTLCEASGALAEYQGESGRNMFTRGKEHLREFFGGVSSNCMVIHSKTHHQGSKQLSYRMEPSGTFRTPLDRQLDESLRLKYSNGSIVLNSGSEWRGDPIPRASFVSGVQAK